MNTSLRHFKIYYPAHEILTLSAASRKEVQKIAFERILSTKPKAKIKYMSVVEVRS